MSDMLSHGGDDERPPWRPARWMLSAAVVVVVAALVAGVSVLAAGQDERSHAAGSASPSATPGGMDLPVLEVAPRDAVAMLLPGMRAGTIETHDPWKNRGPWTVTVRRRDGSFGRHGAVVTFPVPEPVQGRAVRVGDVEGRLDRRTLTWPIAGGYARVRGDLGTHTLRAIAGRTTVRDGHPVVRPPEGLGVAGSGPYRPTEITEARYGFHGEDVSGLVSLGIMKSGGFEDAVYAGPSIYQTTVRGRPAVATPIFGGNFAIAWEVRPGVVAYVGDSGMQLSRDSVDALCKVAQRAQFVDRERWRATRPQVMDQVTHLDPTG